MGSIRFRTANDVRYRAVGTECVVIRQNAAEVLALNGVGARVLELLDTGKTLEELLATMTDEYDANPADLRRDVESFLAELRDVGVLEEVAEP